MSLRRALASIAIFVGACLSPTLTARAIEADLSTHVVEIRTTFRGTELVVFGALTGDDVAWPAPPSDVIVVVRGPPEAITVRRKEKLGTIWANRTSLIALNVPSFYSVASTAPIEEIADEQTLERYGIGFDHLNLKFVERATLLGAGEAPLSPAATDIEFDLESNPPAVPPLDPAATIEEQAGAFRDALLRLMRAQDRYTQGGSLTFIEAQLFRTDVTLPANVPPGAYGAEVYVVQDRTVVDAAFVAFFIDKKGIEADVYGLAQDNPIFHGFLGVIIAVLAGLGSEWFFRKR